MEGLHGFIYMTVLLAELITGGYTEDSRIFISETEKKCKLIALQFTNKHSLIKRPECIKIEKNAYQKHIASGPVYFGTDLDPTSPAIAGYINGKPVGWTLKNEKRR